MTPGERPPRIEYAQVGAIEEQAPARVERQAVADTDAPGAVEGCTPGRQHHRRQHISRIENRDPRGFRQRCRASQREPKDCREGRRSGIGQRTYTRCWTTMRPNAAPPSDEISRDTAVRWTGCRAK